MDIRLQTEPLAPGALLDGFAAGRRETGAIVSFTGLMRAEGGTAERLELDAYPGFTEAEIARAAEAAQARFEVQDLLVVHRYGMIQPGEPIVLVAAAARHRRAAFEAADHMMDYLKTRAPIWKRSRGPEVDRWIEPTAQDHRDAARWDEDTRQEPMNAPHPPTARLPAGAGGRYDQAKAFKGVRIAVLTVSDTRDEESDTSGEILADRIVGAGHELAGRAIVPDTVQAIRAQVLDWVAGGAEVVITTGGTGITGRDVTPEALEPLFDKRLDGFSVVFHMVSYAAIGLSTLQSRATAGIVKGAFVFCLPGSNGAVKDGWSVIAPQLDSRHAPCNMVELMPRLLER